MNAIRLTPAVKALLIIYGVVFVIQQTVDTFFGGSVLFTFGLVPAEFVIHHRFYQLFTYSFFHAEVLHVFFNCLMLAFIGPDLESTWGKAKFLQYYFFCILSSGVIYLLFMMFREVGLSAPMVGASGGLYGLLIAYGLIFGERVMLFMMLFPMKAKHFIWILAAIEFFTTAFSRGNGTAGVAHLGGMGAGFIYLWVRATLSIKRRQQASGQLQGFSKALQKLKALNPATKRKTSNHLKLIIDNARDQAKQKPRGPDRGDEDDHDSDPKTWH
jgi:membrane associated rhomboid family serine protease